MQIPSGPEALLHIKAGYMTAADPSMPKMNDIPLATKGGSIHDHWYSAALGTLFQKSYFLVGGPHASTTHFPLDSSSFQITYLNIVN